MYEMKFNEETGLLELTLTGFWTVDTVHAFHRDYLRQVEIYSRRFPLFPALSDSRELTVLSAEASEAFAAGSLETAQRHRGRIAVVFKSALAKMQAERRSLEMEAQGIDAGQNRYFTDIAEARQWLLGSN